MVSLFPKDTWNNRPNGLRKDLVQLLAGLKPGFLRFPGGCIVEGRRLELRYRWKKTVGDVAERRAMIKDPLYKLVGPFQATESSLTVLNKQKKSLDAKGEDTDKVEKRMRELHERFNKKMNEIIDK